MSGLEQALGRLRDQPPVLQPLGVHAVFDLISAASSPSPAAITVCLGVSSPDAAAVAVQRLVQLATAGRVSRGAAQDLLLAAASGAPVPHLPALLDGLVDLVVAHPPVGPVAWPRHPLCRALHVGPSAADAAVQAAVRALWGGRGGATLQRTLRALCPVLWCATCDPGLGPGARASAAASLARLAAGLAAEPRTGDLEAAASLVSMLCRALSMWDPHDAPSLAPVVGPTLDAWQALRFELQGTAAEDLDRQLGDALLSLALAAGNRPATLRQLSAALHVVGWGPGAPASQALALAFLAGTAGTACAPGLLALLGRFLGDDQEAAARPDRAAALLIAFPLVHLASLAADAGTRAWAGGVLKRVAGLQCPLLPGTESLNPNAHPKAQPACRSIAAPRPWARYAVALEALRALWRGSREAARGWLVALRTHAGACGQSPSSLPVGMLCALLRHLDVETCEEALRTLAALAGPGAGGTAVVLLAQLLRALREETRAGPAMAMLRQLPALGKHTEALPFVLLSLQRLFHPGSDPRLRELGFELMEAAWKANRRAYSALQTCLLSATRASASGNPGPQPSVAQLRAVCSVCAQDPNKGVEFLGLIQAGLSSTGADALQALALRCVRQLCAADVLEFYSAWRAVVVFLPTLPTADGTAAEWLDLMAHGALDAAAEPEVVGGILDALWLATQHRSAAVRLAALRSLAAYDYSLLEESEEAPDVPDLLALLVCEEDEACLDAAGKLLGAALVFDYSRLQGTGMASVGTQDASPLEDSLVALSKSMLDGGSQAAPALLRRLPSLSPVAVLAFWAPPLPQGATGPSTAAAAAAADAYAAVLAELVSMGDVVPGLRVPGTEAAELGACERVCRAFFSRWAAAGRASGVPAPAARHFEGLEVRAGDAAAAPAERAAACWCLGVLAGMHPQLLDRRGREALGQMAGCVERPPAVRRAATLGLAALLARVPGEDAAREGERLLASVCSGEDGGTPSQTKALRRAVGGALRASESVAAVPYMPPTEAWRRLGDAPPSPAEPETAALTLAGAGPGAARPADARKLVEALTGAALGSRGAARQGAARRLCVLLEGGTLEPELESAALETLEKLVIAARSDRDAREACWPVVALCLDTIAMLKKRQRRAVSSTPSLVNSMLGMLRADPGLRPGPAAAMLRALSCLKRLPPGSQLGGILRRALGSSAGGDSTKPAPGKAVGEECMVHANNPLVLWSSAVELLAKHPRWAPDAALLLLDGLRDDGEAEEADSRSASRMGRQETLAEPAQGPALGPMPRGARVAALQALPGFLSVAPEPAGSLRGVCAAVLCRERDSPSRLAELHALLTSLRRLQSGQAETSSSAPGVLPRAAAECVLRSVLDQTPPTLPFLSLSDGASIGGPVPDGAEAEGKAPSQAAPGCFPSGAIARCWDSIMACLALIDPAEVEGALAQRLHGRPDAGAEFALASAVARGILPGDALQLGLNAVLFDPGAATPGGEASQGRGGGSLHRRCGWVAQAAARLGPGQQRHWVTTACRMAQGATSPRAARCLVSWLGLAVAGDSWLCAFPDGSSTEEGVLALLPQALGDLVLDKDWAPCVTEVLAGPLRTLLPTQDYLQCLFAARRVLPGSMWEELLSGWDDELAAAVE
ncbi:hypothetical protein ACKKBF_B04115 [Auxenochlorella protothecoides x Auxenochlorella symbiontica]